MRSMVEGALGSRNDGSDSAVQVSKTVRREQGKHFVAVVSKETVARFVAPGSITGVVRKAVDLHREASAGAVEIDHIGPDGVLPAEPEAGPFAAQALPHQALGQGHFAAQLAGGVDHWALRGARTPSTALRAVPLPVPGRNWRKPAHAVHPA